MSSQELRAATREMIDKEIGDQTFHLVENVSPTFEAYLTRAHYIRGLQIARKYLDDAFKDLNNLPE